MIKNVIFILLSFLFLSCSEVEKVENTQPVIEKVKWPEVPANTIAKSKLDYNNRTSLWTLDGKRFSGYALSYFPDGTLMQKIGFLNGKKQNECIDWYTDRQVKQSAYYHKGKLHGEKRTWSPGSQHLLISHLHYFEGKVHGVQKKWYATGEIFKILNLEMGKEEGLQQAFRKNGDLFANYEAQNGRIFGLKRAALCFGLDNENI